MPIYPTLATCAVLVVIVLEVKVLRTGLLREAAYWISMGICLAFMIPVDGWLTKLSAPVFVYRPEDTSGVRPIWDILIEEFAFAFALLTGVMLVWDWLGQREPARDRVASPSGRRVRD